MSSIVELKIKYTHPFTQIANLTMTLINAKSCKVSQWQHQFNSFNRKKDLIDFSTNCSSKLGCDLSKKYLLKVRI